MNNRLAGTFQIAKYFFIALLFPLLNSCKDNSGTLSPNILPKSDLISAHEVDTTTIVTSMYLKDSVVTNGATNSQLGSLNDPAFGESKASIYAEVYPSTYPYIPWENGAIADSTFLILPLVQGQPPYGGMDDQTFVVYRTVDNLVSAKAYYSDTNFKCYPTPIGSAQVNVAHALQTDTLKIKLTQDFQKYLTTEVQFTNNWTSNFNTNVIQGIYVTAANSLQLPGQGGILYVNLNSSFASIVSYYHYPAPRGDTAYSVTFPVGEGIFFNNFNHNYATTSIVATHPSGPRDSVSAGQLIYVGAMGGIFGRINFPNLYKNWSKLGPVLINEAVLTLPIDQQYVSANFSIPDNLYVYGTGPTWQPYLIPDANNGGQGQSSYNGTSYSFIITQYLQSIINGKNDSDRGLYIAPGNTVLTANRVVLYGAQHGINLANRASLTIYYTPVKN